MARELETAAETSAGFASAITAGDVDAALSHWATATTHMTVTIPGEAGPVVMTTRGTVDYVRQADGLRILRDEIIVAEA